MVLVLPMVRGLLQGSDMLAAVSASQMRFETDNGLLSVLPVPLPDTTRRIGLTCRAGSLPSPATQALLRFIYHCDDWLCDPGAAHFRMDQRAKADEGVEQSLWFTVYAGRGAARLRPPCLNHGISLAKRGSPGERRFLSARAGAQSG